jgi:hypothetical protein
VLVEFSNTIFRREVNTHTIEWVKKKTNPPGASVILATQKAEIRRIAV